jgi:hypothetical protein
MEFFELNFDLNIVILILLGCCLCLFLCRMRSGGGATLIGLVFFIISLSIYLLIAAVFMGVLVCVWNCVFPQQPTPPVFKTQNQPNHNNYLDYLKHWQHQFSVSRSDLSFANESVSQEQFLFSLNIHQQRAVYFFKSQKYTLLTPPLPPITLQLCEALRCLEHPPNPPEALKAALFDISASHQPVENLILEMLLLLDKGIRALNQPVIIGIKGYADGEVREWQQKLIRKYAYKKIEYFSSDKLLSLSPHTHTIGNTYANKDLPYLRAHYLKQRLILPYLKTCHKHLAPDVRVIQGEVYSYHDKSERKAEIYLIAKE